MHTNIRLVRKINKTAAMRPHFSATTCNGRSFPDGDELRLKALTNAFFRGIFFLGHSLFVWIQEKKEERTDGN